MQSHGDGHVPGMVEEEQEGQGASQGALVIKILPASAGDVRDMIPESGRSPGGGHDNPLQYSCLENHMDRGAWRATVHRVANTRTRRKHSVHARRPGWL